MVVITLGHRDDLSTTGGQPFVWPASSVRAALPGTTIELLVPEFLRQLGRPCPP